MITCIYNLNSYLISLIFMLILCNYDACYLNFMNFLHWYADVSFSCVVKTQKCWSNKIYKTELTKIRYKNQVMCKYQVDPQRVGLTLIAELTWSNLGLKGVLNK